MVPPSPSTSGPRSRHVSSLGLTSDQLNEYTSLIPISHGSRYATEANLPIKQLGITRNAVHSAQEEDEDEETGTTLKPKVVTKRAKAQKTRELDSPKSLLRSLQTLPGARWPTYGARHEWSLADEVDGILARHVREEEHEKKQWRNILAVDSAGAAEETSPSSPAPHASSPAPGPDEGCSDVLMRSPPRSSSSASRPSSRAPTSSPSRSPSPTTMSLLLPTIAAAQQTLSHLFETLHQLDANAPNRRLPYVEWKQVLTAMRSMGLHEELVRRVEMRCVALFDDEEQGVEMQDAPSSLQEVASDPLETNIYHSLATPSSSTAPAPCRHPCTSSLDALLLLDPLHLPVQPSAQSYASNTLWHADTLLSAPLATSLAPRVSRKKRDGAVQKAHERAQRGVRKVRQLWDAEEKRHMEKREKVRLRNEVESLWEDSVQQRDAEQPASPRQRELSPPEPPRTSPAPTSPPRATTPCSEQRPAKRRRKDKQKDQRRFLDETSEFVPASASADVIEPEGSSIMASLERSTSSFVPASFASASSSRVAPLHRASQGVSMPVPGPRPSKSFVAPLECAVFAPPPPPLPSTSAWASKNAIPLQSAAPPLEAASHDTKRQKTKVDVGSSRRQGASASSQWARKGKGKKRERGF